MVHTNRDVIALPGRLVEHRVGRHGSGYINTQGPQLIDGGLDNLRLGAAQVTRLARMRVQAGNGQTGRRITQVAVEGSGSNRRLLYN